MEWMDKWLGFFRYAWSNSERGNKCVCCYIRYIVHAYTENIENVKMLLYIS